MVREKAIRLIPIDYEGYTLYKEVPMPCIPLGVDSGGWCCSKLPKVIKRLKRKKIGDRMWISVQYHQNRPPYLAILTDLKWNNDKTSVAARFSGGILDHITRLN